MAIIGILAAAAIVNFGKNEDRDVRAEKDRLTSFLREVQNKALTGDRVGVSAGGGKVCGYGVHRSDSSTIQTYYIVTSDLDADCSSVSNTYDSSRLLDAFHFTNGVTISSSFFDVFFLSPNGSIYYNGSNNSSNFPINIGLTKGSITLSPAVSIDQAGRIY